MGTSYDATNDQSSNPMPPRPKSKPGRGTQATFEVLGDAGPATQAGGHTAAGKAAGKAAGNATAGGGRVTRWSRGKLATVSIHAQAARDRRDRLKLALLYAAFAGAGALQHAHNLVQYWLDGGGGGGGGSGANGSSSSSGGGGGGGGSSLAEALAALVAAGWSNSCQASIAWDAVLSGGACLCYMLATGSRQQQLARTASAADADVADASPSFLANGGLPYVLASPFVSVAASFSMFLAVGSWNEAEGVAGGGRRRVTVICKKIKLVSGAEKREAPLVKERG